MKKLLLTLFCLGLVSAAIASPRVETSGKYVYIVTPLNEMKDADKRESLNEANTFIIKELEKLFPAKTTNKDEIIADIAKKKAAIDQVVEYADAYLKNDEPGIRPYDLYPSAYMFIFGGGFSKQFVLNISGSFNIGLVIMPSLVKRITKGDPSQVKKYYTFECSLVFLPVGNIGVGMSPEAAEKLDTRLRVGFGLIWGEMIQPGDFYGLTAGITASTTLGPDFQGQLLGVVNNKGVVPDPNGMKFVFANIAMTKGATKKLELMANVGFVKPLVSFMRAYDAISGNFLGGAGSLQGGQIPGIPGIPGTLPLPGQPQQPGIPTNPSTLPSQSPSPSLPANPGLGRGPFMPIPAGLSIQESDYLHLKNALDKIEAKKRAERAERE